MRFDVGSVFAGYTIVSRLGRGGTATVYLAREPGLERLVALKVLPPEQLAKIEFKVTLPAGKGDTASRATHP